MSEGCLDQKLLNVKKLNAEFHQELISIVNWWLEHVVDINASKIIGEIDDSNKASESSGKSAVYTARLLWFFSKTAGITKDKSQRAAADLVYACLEEHFLDKENGGIIWELDAENEVIDSRKQVYAQAFYIYALCAYYDLTGKEDVLQRADEIYGLIEAYAHDDKKKGYIEALSSVWGPQDDLRLSEKEPNLPKTMNTHLHVLEAYTSLHAVKRSKETKLSLRRVLNYFVDYFINDQTGHLNLFFDDDWNNQSSGYSYGHDIECSWLIWEAAEALDDEEVLRKIKPICIRIADTCLQEGSGVYGELVDGYDFTKNEIVPEHVWWVQAEALVGYLNAYQLSDDSKYIGAFNSTWDFIKQYQKDNQCGEWHWFSILDLEKEEQHYKAGFWKAPYHNGRAMMEVCDRLKQLSEKMK